MFVKLTHNNTHKLFETNYTKIKSYINDNLKLHDFQLTFQDSILGNDVFVIDDQESLQLIISLLKEINPAANLLKVSLVTVSENVQLPDSSVIIAQQQPKQEVEVSKVEEKEVQPEVKPVEIEKKEVEVEVKNEQVVDPEVQQEKVEQKTLESTKASEQPEKEKRCHWKNMTPAERQAKKAHRQEKIREIVKDELSKILPELKDCKFNQQQKPKVVHPGVTCDGCKLTPITGIRYKCSFLPDFDFCENCEATKQHPHAFVKLNTPQQAMEYYRMKAERGQGGRKCHQERSNEHHIDLGEIRIDKILKNICKSFTRPDSTEKQEKKQKRERTENHSVEKQQRMAKKIKKVYPELDEESVLLSIQQNPLMNKHQIISILTGN